RCHRNEFRKLQESSTGVRNTETPSAVVCCLKMGGAAKYIISAVLGSFAISFAFDHILADKKIFGGTTPKTVANKEWWDETDRKFQAWPRTAGPPVVMNPISRQNFIVKSRTTES
ncbi:uncharacterized protein LOC115953152, partial [Quercus lobata]